MPLPQLTVNRHDRTTRALITLAGEIDLESAPLVRVFLEQCLRDGVRAVDVDLAHVTFCDCTGLNVFLRAAQQTEALCGTLRLHHPPTTLLRMLEVVGDRFLLLGPSSGRPPPPRADTPATPVPGPAHRSVRPVSVLSGVPAGGGPGGA
ncbi:STAS domain-containing protein [Streptomyces sp. W16]|uniref:STAS domain-containing protein n=1 Tax=Streptomyces sp. W16 TaxID=3076631 RepID=UPI00295C27E2|nr:STAS domain-containing protein [Streptomyces sp. W16]MDV9174693.1 STAS domain-containing protein [Streptomyces sp. W16]